MYFRKDSWKGNSGKLLNLKDLQDLHAAQKENFQSLFNLATLAFLLGRATKKLKEREDKHQYPDGIDQSVNYLHKIYACLHYFL